MLPLYIFAQTLDHNVSIIPAHNCGVQGVLLGFAGRIRTRDIIDRIFAGLQYFGPQVLRFGGKGQSENDLGQAACRTVLKSNKRT